MILTAVADGSIVQSFTSFVQDFGIFLNNITGFIRQFFIDLVYVIHLWNKSLTALPAYFSWLPAGVVGILGLTFTLVVVFKVVGRL
jgi:hypothetical protein